MRLSLVFAMQHVAAKQASAGTSWIPDYAQWRAFGFHRWLPQRVPAATFDRPTSARLQGDLDRANQGCSIQRLEQTLGGAFLQQPSTKRFTTVVIDEHDG